MFRADFDRACQSLFTDPCSRFSPSALVSSAGFRVSRKQASRDCAVAACHAIVNVELVGVRSELARTIDLRATIIYKDREPNMHVILQRIQLFVTLLLVIGSPMVACASEPITVVYGHGRVAHGPNNHWTNPA